MDKLFFAAVIIGAVALAGTSIELLADVTLEECTGRFLEVIAENDETLGEAEVLFERFWEKHDEFFEDLAEVDCGF